MSEIINIHTIRLTTEEMTALYSTALSPEVLDKISESSHPDTKKIVGHLKSVALKLQKEIFG